jgi:hypothetical protein
MGQNGNTQWIDVEYTLEQTWHSKWNRHGIQHGTEHGIKVAQKSKTMTWNRNGNTKLNRNKILGVTEM